MFYNVENLFYPGDDSLTNDDDFTPGAVRHWNFYRYQEKLNKIFKTVTAAGGWSGFDLIGLCEVENEQVLYDLINKTPFLKLNYKFLHKNSDDDRGIDVALLYRKGKFKPEEVNFLRIFSPLHKELNTRDILYTKGAVSEDTLHVFVNHWPSRWNGEKNTREFRNLAAGVLKKAVDSVLSLTPDAKVIIMGDFNDEPNDASLSEYLKACTNPDSVDFNNLFNLSGRYLGNSQTGTYKYQGKWQIFDQFIVSSNLLINNNGWFTSSENVIIHQFQFLLEEEKDLPGKKPFRTYRGYRYSGGYSDHLPISITLTKSKNTDK